MTKDYNGPKLKSTSSSRPQKSANPQSATIWLMDQQRSEIVLNTNNDGTVTVRDVDDILGEDSSHKDMNSAIAYVKEELRRSNVEDGGDDEFEIDEFVKIVYSK